MKRDKYSKKVKLYKLIDEEVMKIHIKEILDKILVKYDDVVSKESYDIKNCKLIKYNIRLNDERSIKCKQSLRLIKKNEWIKGQIDKMLKNGVIESFTSLYIFNIIIVRKKDRISKECA